MPFPFNITSQTPDILQHAAVVGQGNLNRFTNVLEAHKERDKRDAEEAKRQRALSKMFQEELGLSDSDVQSLDAPTLRGMNEGYLLKNSQAHQAALTQLQLANAELNQQRLAFEVLREKQTEAQARVPGQILRRAEAGMPIGVLTQESYDEELARRSGMSQAALNMLRAYNEVGAALPEEFVRGAGMGTDFQPSMKELAGHKVIYSPKTGVFTVAADDPSAAATLRGAKDEEGNKIPGMFLTPKGTPFESKTKPKREPGEGPKLSKDGKFYWDDNAQAWKPIRTGSFEEALERLRGVGEGGGAAQPEALPMPKTQAELKKGAVYQTTRGAAIWDGEKFMLK